ncbi:UvrD-helicase domain-containing protein [Streptomyces sp. 796.1]|uniref:UvrD-helicase domain-containing protein n=1 Tax=Streptomyces sp. 796.1 TaxID=3163029 RepID=UPI0039C9666F
MSTQLTDPEQLKELLGIPFTPEQVACITAPLAPQVIVAGAGSGKTTVMAARVVWLVGTGQVAPEQVLGLTFTNKAAGELAERVRKALLRAGIGEPTGAEAGGGTRSGRGGGRDTHGRAPAPYGIASGAEDEVPGEPRISTYHAFAGQLLKDHGLRIGVEPGARLLADATRFQLAARVLRAAPGPYPALTRSFADLVTDLLALDGELAEHLVPVERLREYDTALLTTLGEAKLTNDDLRKAPDTALARLELLGLVERYRAEKRRLDLLDFGDQIALSAALARNHPEVGRALRAEFAVVLLDEYQDTSVAQRLLLSSLFGAGDAGGTDAAHAGADGAGARAGATAGGGIGHAVTAVGDPCQAIYGWRGASVANLDDFPLHFPRTTGPRPAASPTEPGTESGTPTRTPSRTDAAEATQRGPAPAASDADTTGATGPSAPATASPAPTGTPTAAPATAPAERFSLSENRRSGGRLLELANRLAAPLRARHAGVAALRPAPGAEGEGLVRCALLPTHADEMAWLADSIAHLVRTGTAPGEIAVLCRTAADFGEIQGALVARDVPVEVVGLSGLLHLPEVADLVAVCEVLQDPTANAALVRLLTGPRWRIGARDLALLGRRARTLVGRDHAGPAQDADRRLAEAVEGVDPAEAISLADALDTFVTDTATPQAGPAAPPALPDSHAPADPQDAGAGQDLRDRGEAGQAGQAAGADLPFSPQARVRFARLAAELRELRRSLGDPLMDVLHRILAVTGLEVELSASPHALAARRRETLGNFLDVAAGFATRAGGSPVADGAPTLLAFLGFLRTAAQYEKGLDNALPGGENTVKVLTAHKSKGLEWDVVAVPGLVTKTFPSEQAREAWTASAKVLPHALRGDADTLPDVSSWDAKGLAAFKAAMKEHQRTEELRLGYVTFTRPRSLLLGSGHWWGPSQKRPRGPSAFLTALREHCEAGDGEIEVWADEPAPGEQNPALQDPEPDQPSRADRRWPLPLDATALDRRRRAAEAVLTHLDHQPPPPATSPAAGHRPSHLAPARDTSDPKAYPEPYGAGPLAPEPYEPEPYEAAAPTEPPAAPASAYDDPYAEPPEDPYGEDPYGEDPYAADPYGEDSYAADPYAGDPYADPYTAPDAAPDGEQHAPYDTAHAPAPDGHRHGRSHPDGPDGGRSSASSASSAAPEVGPAVGRGGAERPAGAGAAALLPEEARLAASWDRDLEVLAKELRRARATVREVPVPAALSATQLLRLAADPDGFARELARPMPRPPRPAARRGTRFHAWVESRFEALPLPLLGPEDLPGAEEYGADPEGDGWDLDALKEAFNRTPYARRTPYRIEAPFHLTLAGRVVRGRIDAVYRHRLPSTEPHGAATTLAGTPARGPSTGDPGDAPQGISTAAPSAPAAHQDAPPPQAPHSHPYAYEIVDWKTNRAQDADPLQLAVYRLAWAEQHGLPLSAVTATFLYVRTGEIVRPTPLPGRAEIERILLGEPVTPGERTDRSRPAERTRAPGPT